MHRIFPIWILLMSSTLCMAQHQVFYKQYSPLLGLASSETYCVKADNDGYLWIGTDRGLNRFDGKNFTTYTIADGLSSNFVNKVFINPNTGSIWVVCFDQQLFYFKNNKFHPFVSNMELRAGMSKSPKATIEDIHFLKDDIQYIYTSKKGRLKVTNQRVVFPDSPPNYTSIIVRLDEYNKLSGLTPLLMDYVTTGFQYGLPIQYQWGDSVFNTTTWNYKTLSNNWLTTVRRKNGAVLFARDNYLFEMVNGTITKNRTFLYPIVSMYEASDSSLWVCTFSQEGVQQYPPNDFPTANNAVSFFKTKQITNITEDIQGGYWFTTHSDGLVYVPHLGVKKLALPIREASGEVPTRVAASQNNDVFISTNKNNILYYNRRYWDTTKYRAATIGSFFNNRIAKIINSQQVKNSFSSLYYHQGTNSLYYSTPSPIKINKSGNAIPYEFDAINFYPINDTTDVLCGYYGVRINTPNKNVTINHSAYIFGAGLSAQGSFWTGGFDGLLRIKENQLVKDPIINYNKRINAIRQLPNGKLVAATLGNGLIVFDDNKMDTISLGSDMRYNMVNDLVVHQDTVFAATQLGVVWFKYGSKHPALQYIGPSRGQEFYDTKSIAFANNVLYVLDKEVLFTIDIQKHKAGSPKLLPLYISSFTVNDTIEKNTDQKVVLASNEQRIKIAFTGINFKNSTKSVFAYRLVNTQKAKSDTAWNITQASVVDFYGLESGKYSFEVMGLGEGNFPTTAIKKVGFEIQKPFYATWYFYVALGALLFLGLIYVNKKRISALQKQNMISEQLLTYEQQALAAQINPHFLFNSLNSIQSFILKKDERQTLKYITKFSRLMRMSLDNSRAKWVVPQAEIDLIKVYLELEQLRFKDKFDFEIVIDPLLNTEKFVIAPMLAQPFIENAIKHGVNNLLDRKGRISLRATLMMPNQNVLIEIEDNGVGRAKAKEMSSDFSKNHLSAGLDITINRIRLLSYECGCDFYFNIIDKPNDGGTIIEFYLPHKKNVIRT